jgi:oligoendopeptidase F
MHNNYTCHNQPYRYSNYSTHVSEVASTFNESLLFHFLLKKAKTEKNKELELYLVNSRCDDFKGTLVRQVEFAEFEREMYYMAERGEPLTTESLSKLYKGINDVYYGDQALLKKDSGSSGSNNIQFPHKFEARSEISFEFLRIPHFFYDFYVVLINLDIYFFNSCFN